MNSRLVCLRLRLQAAELWDKICQSGSGYGFFQSALFFSKKQRHSVQDTGGLVIGRDPEQDTAPRVFEGRWFRWYPAYFLAPVASAAF
ncbi:MAG: hypothetical protein A2931_00245 [Candidatus Niyogibacteria bacterium RIFCSPLOWO2_01_FULL_45_48]|uniref:Uncharacterized protein n=2 Tax=Candidatus Niyogiibacteriota TaxID=1817912 RepID=A0A1G2EXP0_9BACT|nr:MAG: hypothetical protein A2931_00245 [Candidatus Niyogibacteria bacterium RIFCSPLOWO2_01_FULL_45_48]OGZ30574.1 MAG: hypothetical protein A3J00_03845 [Candidatus Niyogibacteria bacterium RIFCSPLOWO2_02_FULL_45_13]